MTDSINLGQIAGIRIGLNWSVLALAGLLVWSLGSFFFPEALPESTAALHWTLAVIATLIALLSILLHEIGHALQARRDGMRIDGITLWMFGGVARFRGSFPSAPAEFRIAIAGPLVSLGLAVAFAGGLALPGVPEAARDVLFWLAYINAALFLFNLIPALPLDGGRILRAILWQATGDFSRGTTVAAKIAQGLAWAMIAVGVVIFALLQALSGIWLVFIAWFLLQAARAETRALVGRSALGDLRVRDVMTRADVVVGAETPAAVFVDRTVFSPSGASYPVVNAGRLVGVVSPSALAQTPREARADMTVADVMRPIDAVPVVDPDDLLADAAARLGHGLDRLPVARDGHLVGVLTISALARALGVRARQTATG